MAVSLMSKLFDTPLAFVDVETTGASPEYGDRIIELGIARVERGEVVARYQQLIDPQRAIGAGITALTGITSEMCAGQPLFEEVASQAVELMGGAVAVGHNVPFDLGFLRQEFRRCGRDLPKELPGTLVMDTVRIARKLFGRGGNGLQKLALRFGVQDMTAHRALADALTTARVFEKLIEPTGGWQMTLVDAIQLQGGVMKLEAAPKASALPYELEDALSQRGPVEMEYVDARESRTLRIVTPIEVRKFRGDLVLLAYCDLRKERRTFKLDRIVRLTRIDPDAQVTPPTAAQSVPAPRKDILPPLIRASQLPGLTSS